MLTVVSVLLFWTGSSSRRELQLQRLLSFLLIFYTFQRSIHDLVFNHESGKPSQQSKTLRKSMMTFLRLLYFTKHYVE